MTEALSTQYDPRSIEEPLYRTWEERGYFRADARRVLEGGEKPYVIVMHHQIDAESVVGAALDLLDA